jgi:hypothetical protein
LQVDLGVWNLVEKSEEMVNNVTANRKFMKESEYVCG